MGFRVKGLGGELIDLEAFRIAVSGFEHTRFRHWLASSQKAIREWIRGSQRVLSTDMGNPCPNHKGNSYSRNPTLYHIGTLDPTP